jgi:hypothetical protein
VTLNRLNSALTAGLVLTVLIIASISGFSSGGTVTAQQNNTTATPPPSADLQGSHSPATVPTAVEPTGTSTPFRDIQEYQPTLPATATLTTRYPTETEKTQTQTQTPTATATATLTPTVTATDSPGFGISTPFIAGLAILLTAYRVST